MTDMRSGDDYELDENRLPWLEAVEEEHDRSGPSAAKIVASVLIGLVILGFVITGIYWLRTPSAGPAGPELIEAEKGDYKVKPTDPGGMKVEGSGESSFAASEGEEVSGKLNMEAMPEAPVERPAPAPKAAPAPAPVPAKAEPRPAPKAEPAPAPSGPTIQLGAFASGAIANDAWKRLSGRFSYLAGLDHSVVSAVVNGKTYYRLRASGPDAKAICGRLRVAGEDCVAVN